jgi:DNA ligase D-like protein (predicted 3'-phosphoesterase)
MVEVVAADDVNDPPSFVIQRHDASTLHFDFRLEVDGVLVSWAVPRGPSVSSGDKRLAVRTDDHGLDYLEFEGRIGEGYGSGSVIVWDIGAYANLTNRDGARVDASEAIRNGHLSVWLEGERLHGGYALTRTGVRAGREHWLLVKRKDSASRSGPQPVDVELCSVLSGRTNEEV